MGRVGAAFEALHALPEVQRAEDEVVLAVHGDVDVASAPALREALVELIDASHDGASVVLDLRRLTFIDSTGLGVLVGARRRGLERGVQLVVGSPTPATMRVMDITGLSTMFEIRRDVDA